MDWLPRTCLPPAKPVLSFKRKNNYRLIPQQFPGEARTLAVYNGTVALLLNRIIPAKCRFLLLSFLRFGSGACISFFPERLLFFILYRFNLDPRILPGQFGYLVTRNYLYQNQNQQMYDVPSSLITPRITTVKLTVEDNYRQGQFMIRIVVNSEQTFYKLVRRKLI